MSVSPCSDSALPALVKLPLVSTCTWGILTFPYKILKSRQVALLPLGRFWGRHWTLELIPKAQRWKGYMLCRSSSRAAFQFLQSCYLLGEAGGKLSLHLRPPVLGLGLGPSHGLGISVSLADKHLQEPEFRLYVLIFVVFFSHGSAVFFLDISNGNKGKGGWGSFAASPRWYRSSGELSSCRHFAGYQPVESVFPSVPWYQDRSWV